MSSFYRILHVDRNGNRLKKIEKDDLKEVLSAGEKKFPYCIFFIDLILKKSVSCKIKIALW